jgi:hypothetical protein
MRASRCRNVIISPRIVCIAGAALRPTPALDVLADGAPGVDH